MLYKIESYPDLLKDSNSKAVLNNNFSALEEYKRKQALVSKVNLMEKDISDIKQNLNVILEILKHKDR
jgi:hypothetical protein